MHLNGVHTVCLPVVADTCLRRALTETISAVSRVTWTRTGRSRVGRKWSFLYLGLPLPGVWHRAVVGLGGGRDGRGKMMVTGVITGGGGAQVGGQLVVPAGLGVVLEEPLVLADDHLHHLGQARADAHVHGIGHTLTVPYLQHRRDKHIVLVLDFNIS